jgi:hypothetical protein
MKNSLLFLLVIITIFSCKKDQPKQKYTTISYLEVNKIQESLNKLLQGDVYKVWRENACFNDSLVDKHLTFVGTSHNQDTTHAQFQVLEDLFNEVKPQIAFNEGGNWKIEGKYKSRNKAILGSGEVGLLQFLCDKNHIKMINGDMPDKDEYKVLFSEYPFEKVYLLLGIERFVNPYKNGAYKDLDIKRAFETKFIVGDFVNNGIKLTKEQATFEYLKKIHKKYFGRELTMETMEPMSEYFLSNQTEFGVLHRRSKEIRDSVLLGKIDSTLNKKDRVFVVFGASHLLALKPALKQIINRKRE